VLLLLRLWSRHFIFGAAFLAALDVAILVFYVLPFPRFRVPLSLFWSSVSLPLWMPLSPMVSGTANFTPLGSAFLLLLTFDFSWILGYVEIYYGQSDIGSVV
jgi:hypothetical protein